MNEGNVVWGRRIYRKSSCDTPTDFRPNSDKHNKISRKLVGIVKRSNISLEFRRNPNGQKNVRRNFVGIRTVKKISVGILSEMHRISKTVKFLRRNFVGIRTVNMGVGIFSSVSHRSS